MNIKITKDWAITSDERQFILNKVAIAKSGKNQGEEI